MQQAITLEYQGMTLRGMEHVPEQRAGERLPAVILYHGFTGNKLEGHRLFLKISRALANNGYAAFRYDFIGSGESDGDFEDMTVSKEIAEADAILDSVRNDPRIDPDRVILLGMSMGGLVASVLAGDRPQDVHKLVLLCPAGNVYEFVKPMLDAYLADPSLQVVDWGANLVGRAFGEDVKTLDVYGRAQRYPGEVLLIHGTNDPTVPFAVSGLYKERCYGERVTIHPIEGADHTFNKHQWEQEVLRTITSFLS
ncbi:MAG: alpha/beta fold hydrolase [Tumebacillaceae bacterium]